MEFSRKALLKLSEAKVKSRFAVLNSKTVKTEIKGLADSLFDIFNSFKNKYEAKPEEAMKKELIENIQKIRDDALEECKNKYHININELNKYSFLNRIETHYGVYLNFQNENYEEKFEKLVKAEGPEKALKEFQSIKSNLRSLITEKMRHKYNADVERFVDWFVEDLLDFVNSDNKYYRELKSSKLVCTYRSKILYKKGLFSKTADDFLKKAYDIMTKKLEEKIKSDETLRKKVTNILMKVRDLDELDRKLKNILD